MPEESPVNYRKYSLFLFVLILLSLDIFLLHLDIKNSNQGLTFAMLDVGQGDGLFIKSPTGTEVLFDAGPPHRILGQLARVMPPFDKTIDAIVITNPDLDHIGGFIDVLKNYKVDYVFVSGTANNSKYYQNLEEEIKRLNIKEIEVQRGMKLQIGGGAVIDILFPDRDVSLWSPNDGSIVAKMTYGETSFMLAGDSTAKTEKIILEENLGDKLKSTILKIGHHGSRTSTSNEFVQAVAPTYALISDGKDNKYGHPHPETLNTLEEFGINVFRTDILGTIIMQSDGKNVSFSFQK